MNRISAKVIIELIKKNTLLNKLYGTSHMTTEILLYQFNSPAFAFLNIFIALGNRTLFSMCT